MSQNRYLPVWTDGLSYSEQYLACWVADIESDKSLRSLLPIRLKTSSGYGRKDFRKTKTINPCKYPRNVHWWWLEFTVKPMDYYIAEKAYDAAADIFLKEQLDMVSYTIGEQENNGVYKITFRSTYEDRLRVFTQILHEEINRINGAAEFLEFSERHVVDSNDYTTVISGVLNKSDEQLNALLDSIDPNCREYSLERDIHIPISEIMQYFITIPEKLFLLGNQHLAYRQNTQVYRHIYNAAYNADAAAVLEFAKAGGNLNAIDISGCTVFSKLFYGLRYQSKELDYTLLDRLIDLGANPAIWGVNYIASEPLLPCFALDHDLQICEYLLKKGVNPNMYAQWDEAPELIGEDPETLIEEFESWGEGDNPISSISEESKQMAALLKQYA